MSSINSVIKISVSVFHIHALKIFLGCFKDPECAGQLVGKALFHPTITFQKVVLQ